MSTEIDTFSLRLTEQLRDDMLRILSLAELPASDTTTIAALAKGSLRVADAFLLASQQTQLILEPVTAVSILEDVAHDLYPLAKANNIEMEVSLRGTSRPILAHRQSVRDLLNLVGMALVSQQLTTGRIILGTHRSVRGTVLGAFSPDLNELKLRSSADTQNTNNAEVLLSVAARLGERLQTQVKQYKHVSMTGFGATFNQSNQLQLIV